MGHQVVFYPEHQRAILTVFDEKTKKLPVSTPIHGKKDISLNKTITAVYHDAEFGRSLTSEDFTGFLCEGKVFVKLQDTAALLGYFRKQEEDKVILKEESRLLHDITTRKMGFTLPDVWEEVKNNGAVIPLSLVQEAMDIAWSEVNEGAGVVTKQRVTLFRNKETSAYRIQVATDLYFWVPEHHSFTKNYYNVLKKPASVGSLFGRLSGQVK